MTSEQIAELRRIADEYVKNEQRSDYHDRETSLAALPKLLDEREALLAFVRRFAAFAGESLEQRSCNSLALEAEWHAAHEVIAKAES